MNKRTHLPSVVVIVCCLAWATIARGHPGSGIVVDPQGNVFFIDSGHGVWKIDGAGRLTHAFDTSGNHWLSLVPADTFTARDMKNWIAELGIPNFDRLGSGVATPNLITSDGQPFVVGGDGNLYYAKRNLELVRLTPAGKLTPLVAGMADAADKLGGIKALAWGPDGCLYAGYPAAVQRIAPDGKATLVVGPGIDVPDCHDEDVDPAIARPYLRGLAFDADGTIFAAATNCRRVLKIPRVGKPSTIYKSAAPWTPTGVAATPNGDVYVLENDDPKSSANKSFPRVTKIARDGNTRVLATVTRQLSPR